MPTRDGVACAGNWIVEHTYSTTSYPSEGSLARINEQQRTFGGCAYNVIRNLHDLDPEMFLYAIGAIGDDEAGHDLLSDLHRRDLDTFQLIAQPEVATAHAEVIVSKTTGRRTSFYSAGANRLLSPAHFDFSHCLASWLHLGSLMLLDLLDSPDATFGTGAARVLCMAKADGIITSIDLISDDRADYSAVIAPALPHVDFLIVNKFEAARCSDVEITDGVRVGKTQLEECAAALLNKGVQQAVVIHFPEGALAMTKSSESFFSLSLSVPGDQIKNCGGAGDAFSAAFIYASIQRWPLTKRLQLGHCAAAQKLIAANSRSLVGEENFEFMKGFSARAAG